VARADVHCQGAHCGGGGTPPAKDTPSPCHAPYVPSPMCPRTQEQVQLSRSGVMFIVGKLIVAGSDTTSNLVAFALFLLATHPKAEERLVAETRGLARGAPRRLWRTSTSTSTVSW